MQSDRVPGSDLNDPIRVFLRNRGAAQHLVTGGMAGILKRWESVTREIEAGYRFDMDDYRNDMDLRQLLEEAIAVLKPQEREAALAQIALADQRARMHLEPVGRCIWDDATADLNGWNASTNWWYFEKPRRNSFGSGDLSFTKK